MSVEGQPPPPKEGRPGPPEGALPPGKPAKDAAGVRLRNMHMDDIPQILALGRICFPRIPEDRHWQPDMLEAHVRVFAEGQWVAVLGERIVGSAMNLRVRFEDAVKQHSWKEIAGGGYLTTHRPDGDALYGTEIMVHPEVRRRGIARKLYDARKKYIVEQRMKAFVSGGRIPGFEKFAETMPVEEYVAKVEAGVLEDRVLTPQLKNGMVVVGVLRNYLTDPPSRNHATIIVWRPPGRRGPVPLDAVGHE